MFVQEVTLKTFIFLYKLYVVNQTSNFLLDLNLTSSNSSHIFVFMLLHQISVTGTLDDIKVLGRNFSLY